MNSSKTKIVYPQLITTDAGKHVQHSYEEICFNRWADIQLDGTLDVIDQGIAAMVDLARVAMENRSHTVWDDAMDDLEAAAYATTRELRRALALNSTRVAAPNFDPGHLLSATVEQYLSYLPSDVRETIIAGADLAHKCALGVLDVDELTDIELCYREWVTPHLMRHLVCF